MEQQPDIIADYASSYIFGIIPSSSLKGYSQADYLFTLSNFLGDPSDVKNLPKK